MGGDLWVELAAISHQPGRPPSNCLGRNPVAVGHGTWV